MYGIFTYIWVIYWVNVGKYTIHGSYGLGKAPWYPQILPEMDGLYVKSENPMHMDENWGVPIFQETSVCKSGIVLPTLNKRHE